MSIFGANPTLEKTLDALAAQGVIQRILSADTRPISLNYIFDNIRNYTLAGTVMLAGIWLLATEGTIIFVFGLHVTLCGIVLIGLNFIHSMRTLSQMHGRNWPGYLIFITLFIGSLEIVWITFWRVLA